MILDKTERQRPTPFRILRASRHVPRTSIDLIETGITNKLAQESAVLTGGLVAVMGV